MSNRIGKVAVIVGAGVGGLTAARALSDHFDQVEVLENDTLPQDAAPRPGTPQSKHLHALLAGGLNALNSLFPGFDQDLITAGAAPIEMTREYLMYLPEYHPFPRRDLGLTIYSMSRPLIELLIRKRTEQYSNIRFWQGWKALEFVLDPRTKTVSSLRCKAPDGAATLIPFDFAVDATGHGVLTSNLLKSLGQQQPEEAVVEVDLGYVTAVFDIPESAPTDWKALAILPHPEENRRAAFLFPIEGNQWMLVLIGRYDEKPSSNASEFIGHLRNLPVPDIYNAVSKARQRGAIARYVFRASRWRRFDKNYALPENVIPFGDALCRFNPLYGQGMSVAAQQATILQDMLADTAGMGIANYPGREFVLRAQVNIEGPWLTTLVQDYADPRAVGDRPSDLADALKYSAALVRRASEDAYTHKTMLEVQHLLKPRSALKELQINV